MTVTAAYEADDGPLTPEDLVRARSLSPQDQRPTASLFGTSLARGGRQPRGRGCPVMYLDFDGVLHHDACFWHPRKGPYLEAGREHHLFQHAGCLARLLEPFPQVLIVLSTSWVLQYGCAGAARKLPPTLRARVCGATFHSAMDRSVFAGLSRWMQIYRDVGRRSPSGWVAIDNDVADWPSDLMRNLVATDDARGIGDPSTQERLISSLSQICLGEEG